MLHLTHCLLTEYAIELTIEGCYLVERVDLTRIKQLSDARGVIHRLMLQGRETVVEHSIRHMEAVVLKLCLAQLIVE